MGTTNTLVQAVDRPALDRVAEPLSKTVRSAYQSAGAPGELAKNTLHGVWLGHPLHPVLTDVPIGAWTAALALDASAKGDPSMRRAATFVMGVGLVGALGAAVTGLTEWSETEGQSRRTGLIHGLLNVTATALMATAFTMRQRDSHERGTACAWLGYAISVGAAYLGGDLVYNQRIGVTHADADVPEEFTAVADSTALADNSMMRVRVGNADVLLARQRGRVCALIHACSHLGGPLSEGTLKEGSVVCPWHGSEFALDSGVVLNGPSTHNQPCLEVRERDGRIEIKEAARA